MTRRKPDPRRTPQAVAAARIEARDRHDQHVLHRLQQDLTDTEQPRTEDTPS